ncbi:MAG: class I SAM-dependent methyltransferase [Polyangiales bacterium]
MSEEPHSARVLNGTRDHWWNDDFLALIARRTGLDQCSRVLDVGCGQGHFSRRIAQHIRRPFEFVGVDREPRWVELSAQRAKPFLSRTGLDGTMRFQLGAAESLPFDDHTFDAVVCQTVLMHLPEPEKAIAEFVRVVRKGGLVLAAEPNNFGALQRLALSELDEPVEEQLLRTEAITRIIRGKRALGEGDNALGARLPALFRQFKSTQFYSTDRPFVIAPPYESDAEQATIEHLRARCERGEAGWSRREARRCWLAGGGDEARFDRAYESLVAQERRSLARIDAGTYAELSAIVLFVAAART